MAANSVIEQDLDCVEARLRALVPAAPGTVLGRAARGHLDAGGARFRARLALDAGLRLGLTDTQRVAVASACELLHNASLVHDDLQDGDRERRGRPAVWVEHGRAEAVCVGDLFLSAAYAALAPLGGAAATGLTWVHERVAAVIAGQVADLRASTDADGGDGYDVIAAGKSGGLLALPLELPLLVAGRQAALDDAGAAARAFAIGYQIADDLSDVGHDRGGDRLNIVSVLAAAGEREPVAAAVARGRAYLDEAVARAARLPADSGALLRQQAERLAGGLDRRVPPVPA